MPSRLEKLGKYSRELVAAARLGSIAKATEYIKARFADARGKATPEHQQALLEVATHASTIERATRTKIEAILHPEKRKQHVSTYRKEASGLHPDVCEDEVVVNDQKRLYAVFDGMGGYGNGEKASADAAQRVELEMNALPDDATIPEIVAAFKQAFKNAGQTIYDAAYNMGVDDNSKAGTVGVAAKIHVDDRGKRTAIVAHAGDSRAYLRKKDGRLIQLTSDHNLLGTMAAEGKITAADVPYYNQKFANVRNPDRELDNTTVLFSGIDYRNPRAGRKNYTERELYNYCFVVARYVQRNEEPDVATYELEDGDRLLLTSDGIHDLVPDSDIGDAISHGGSSDEVVDRLMKYSHDGIRVGPGGKTEDDRTALLVGEVDVLEEEILNVKVAYVEAARNGEYLPVPLDLVAKEAVELALNDLPDLIKNALEEQFTRQAPDSVERAGWRAMGLGYIIEAAAADAEPTEIKDNTSGVEYAHSEAEIQAVLTTVRQKFASRELLTASDLDNCKPALEQLINDVNTTGDVHGRADLIAWVNNSARRDKALKKMLADSMAWEVGGKQDESMHTAASSEQTLNYADFSRRALQEQQALEILRQRMSHATETRALEQLEYLNPEALTREQVVVDHLAVIIEKLSVTTLDLDALKTSPEVTALSRHIGLPVEWLVHAIHNEHALLLQQAALQEKAGRDWKKAVAKGVAYLAGGTALALVGTPALATTGILFATKIYDAVKTVGVHEGNRKNIEAALLQNLKDTQTAFAALGDADRNLVNATGGFKTMLENLAASLALAKRDRIRSVTNSDEINSNIYSQLIRQFAQTEHDAYRLAQERYEEAVRVNVPADEQTRLYQELLLAQSEFNKVAEPYRRMAQAQAAVASLEHNTAYIEDQQGTNTTLSKSWAERNPKLAGLLGFKADTVSEKISSAAFFTAVGLAGREWMPVRVVAAGFAGARFGNVAGAWLERKIGLQGELLTNADLNSISRTNFASAKEDLKGLHDKVANSREKLLDADFKRKQPKQYAELRSTVDTYEQLTAWANASLAIDQMDKAEMRAWKKAGIKTAARKASKWLIKVGFTGAGTVAGALLGEHLAEIAVAKMEQAGPEPEVSSSDWSGLLSHAKSMLSSLGDNGLFGSKIEDTASEAIIKLTPDELSSLNLSEAHVQELNAHVEGLMQSNLSYADYNAEVQKLVEPLDMAVHPVTVSSHPGLNYGYSEVADGTYMLTVTDPSDGTHFNVDASLYDELKSSLSGSAVGTPVPPHYLQTFLTTGHLPVLRELPPVEAPASIPITPPGAVEPPPAEPTLAAPAPAGPAVPLETPTPPAAAAPAAPAEVVSTSELAKHVVHAEKGLSHGLAGQVGKGEATRLLAETKITLDGRQVSLLNTGVEKADTVSVIVAEHGGHKVIELYDAHTGAKIDPSHYDDYLYIRSGAPTEVIEHATHVAADHPAAETGLGHVPTHAELTGQPDELGDLDAAGMPVPTEDLHDYIGHGLRSYVESHSDWSYLGSLSDDELEARPELSLVREELMRDYQTAHAGAVDTALSGAVVEPAPVAATTTFSLDGMVDTTTERLTPKGIQELGLKQHLDNGQPESYDQFRKEILQLLRADSRDRITGPDGLVFEERDGQLYVDVSGGAREHFPLTEDLYGAITQEYREHVQPDLQGKFDQESFYTALDQAEVVHQFKGFEQAELGLGVLPQDYGQFQAVMKTLMTTHDTTKLTGPNGLTYINEGGTLYVRCVASQYELTPALFKAIEDQYHGHLYQNKFTVDSFNTMVKSLE